MALSHLTSASNESIAALNLKKHEVLNPRDSNELFKYSATAVDCDVKPDLMKDPWFSRCWVVQELTLAPDALVDCGHESLTANAHVYGWLLSPKLGP